MEIPPIKKTRKGVFSCAMATPVDGEDCPETARQNIKRSLGNHPRDVQYGNKRTRYGNWHLVRVHRVCHSYNHFNVLLYMGFIAISAKLMITLARPQ